MDYELVLTCTVPVVLALAGWFVGHWLNVSRDQQNKRRDLRIQYLIEAYRKFEDAANRRESTKRQQVEQALADIQLLGNAREIALAHGVADSLGEAKPSTNVMTLLECLRADLRKELRLETAESSIKVVRFPEEH